MKLALLLVAAGLAGLLGTARVVAQADAIRLEIPDCEGVSGGYVRELVALEVAPRPVLAVGSAPTAGGMRCANGVAQIWVEDKRRATALHLEITLTDLAPQTRPRLLALALSELIATSRLLTTQPAATEPVPQPTAAAPVAPPAAKPAEPVVLPVRAEWQFWLGIGAVSEADPRLIAPALAVGGIAAWEQLALVAELRVERGGCTAESAELSLTALSLALGPAWRWHGRSYQLQLGPAVRAGYVGLQAHARSPQTAGDSLAGFWFGPCAQVSAHARLTQHWLLRAGLEFGYATQTVRGVDQRGVSLLDFGGPWLSAHAGAVWQVE